MSDSEGPGSPEQYSQAGRPQEVSTMSSKGSQHLLFGLMLLCFLVPAFVGLVAFLYHWWTGQIFDRHEVKNLAFLSWGSTLVAQCGYALFRRRDPEPRSRRGYISVPRLNANNQQAMKWEQRNAKRLFYHLYAVAIVIPGIALVLAGGILWCSGYHLARGDIPVFLISAWGGSLVMSSLLAIRSRNERIFFHGAQPKSERNVIFRDAAWTSDSSTTSDVSQVDAPGFDDDSSQ